MREKKNNIEMIIFNSDGKDEWHRRGTNVGSNSFGSMVPYIIKRQIWKYC